VPADHTKVFQWVGIPDPSIVRDTAVFFIRKLTEVPFDYGVLSSDLLLPLLQLMIPDLSLKTINGVLHEPIHSPLPLVVVSLYYFLNLLNSLALILLTCNESQGNSMRHLKGDSISLSPPLEGIFLIDYLIKILARKL
jgi:hypothetical protein